MSLFTVFPLFIPLTRTHYQFSYKKNSNKFYGKSKNPTTFSSHFTFIFFPAHFLLKLSTHILKCRVFPRSCTENYTDIFIFFIFSFLLHCVTSAVWLSKFSALLIFMYTFRVLSRKRHFDKIARSQDIR